MPSCPHHPEQALEVVSSGWFCAACGRLVSTPALDVAVIDVASERLPSTLALLLDDIQRETHPAVRLQRMCDLTEMLLRLCVSIAAAERLDALPAEILGRIRTITRPTLGAWLDIALALTAAPPPGMTVIPELAEAVRGPIQHLLHGPPAGESASAGAPLFDLRNRLAHGAGVSVAALAHHVAPCGLRLATTLRELRWLEDIALVALGPDGVVSALVGPTPHPAGSALISAIPPESLRVGEVWLVRGERSVCLAPLHGYDVPRTGRSHDETPDDVAAPLVYARRHHRRLQATALGAVRTPTAEITGEVALRRFDRLFGLDRQRAGGTDDPAAALLALASRCVGREREVRHVVDEVSRLDGGVLWLHGPMGSGKSMVIAGVLSAMKGRAGLGSRTIPWRFSAGEVTCNRRSFLLHAVRTLIAWHDDGTRFDEDQSTASVEAILRSLLGRLPEGERIVFVVDGLDEVARDDSTIGDLAFRLSKPGVLWLCAGRHEGVLAAVFAPERCVHLFPGKGLPALEREAINEWVKRDAPPGPRDDLLRSEDGRPSRWIDELIERAQGLPLYVHLAIEDLHDGVIRVGETLPTGLTRYLEKQLARFGFDDVGHLLPIVLCLLAAAVEPLSAEALVSALRMAGTTPGVGHGPLRTLVERAFERAGAWVSSESDRDGDRRWRLFHDAIRAHIQESEALVVVRSIAREALARLARSPVDAETPAARRWAARFGVRQLLALDRAHEAVVLLTGAGTLVDRLSFDSGDVVGILADIAEVRSRSSDSDECLDQWGALLRSCGAEVALIGADALVHSAISALPGSHAERSMRELLARRGRRYWVAESRPREVASPPGRSFVWPHTPDFPRGTTALSPDGQLLAILSDNMLGFIDLETGKVRAPVEFKPAFGRTSVGIWRNVYRQTGELRFHPNGRWLLWTSLGDSLGVWDVETLTCLGVGRMDVPTEPLAPIELIAARRSRIESNPGPAEAEVTPLDPPPGDRDGTRPRWGAGKMTVDPGGDLVAVGSGVRTALWQLDHGGRPRPFEVPSLDGLVVTDMATGRLYSAVGCALIVRVLGSSAAPVVLTGHLLPIQRVAVLPDGKRAATASHDGTVRVWDIERSLCVAVFDFQPETRTGGPDHRALKEVLEGAGIDALNQAVPAAMAARRGVSPRAPEPVDLWVGKPEEVVICRDDQQCFGWDLRTGAPRRFRRSTYDSLFMPDGRQEVYLHDGAVRVVPSPEPYRFDRALDPEETYERVFIDRERGTVGWRYRSAYVVETPSAVHRVSLPPLVGEPYVPAVPPAREALYFLDPYETRRVGSITSVWDVRNGRSVALPDDLSEDPREISVASRLGWVAWRCRDGGIAVQQLSEGAAVQKLDDNDVKAALELVGWIARDQALLLILYHEDSFWPVFYRPDVDELFIPPTLFPGSMVGVDDNLTRIIAIDWEGRLGAYDLRTGEPIKRFAQGPPRGSCRAGLACLGTVTALDISVPRVSDPTTSGVPPDTGYFDPHRYFEFFPEVGLLFDASPDGRLILWDVETGEIRHTAAGPADSAFAPVYSASRHELIYTTNRGVLAAWNLDDGVVTSCVSSGGVERDLIIPMGERTAVFSGDRLYWYGLIQGTASPSIGARSLEEHE